MNRTIIQRTAFVILALVLFLGPLFDMVPFIKYITLAVSLFYLFLGWMFPLARKDKPAIENSIAGFIYATVCVASFLELAVMPGARYFTYFGCLLSLSLLIFLFVNRGEVTKGMLLQSLVLFMLAPVPMFVNPVYPG